MYPFSPLQLPFYRAFRAEGPSSEWNRGMGLRLGSRPDVVRLAEAFRRVVERHPALRYVVDDGGERPGQGVRDDVPWPELLVQDVRGLDEAAVVARAQALIDAPFDLRREPSVRLAYLDPGEGGGVLVLVNAHLFADLGTVDVVLHEVAGFYDALGGGPAFEPAAAPEFGPLAARHAAQFEDERAARESFWRTKLAGSSSALAVLGEARPVRERGARGRVTRTLLDAAEVERLSTLREGRRTSTFKIVTAGWAVVVGRNGAQPEVLVGTNVRGAPPGADHAVGTFVNALPLRLPLDERAPFSTLLDAVGEEVGTVQRAALDPGQVVARPDDGGPPFRTLVALGRLRLLPDLSPLFLGAVDVPWTARLGSLEVLGALPLDQHGGHLELELLAVEVGGSLGVTLSYDAEAVGAATAERLLGRLRAVLLQAARAPETAIGALPRMSPDEASDLAKWSTSPREWPSSHPHTLLEAVERHVREHPDRPAVEHEGRVLSYGQLGAAAERIARALVARGVEPGDRVAVALARSEIVPAAFLGVWKAGAAFVPVDPEYPDDRVRAMLEDTGARVALVDATTAPWLQAVGVAVAGVRVDAAADDASERPLPGTKPESLAYVIFTSGSTGRPKGVEIPHRGLTNYVFDVWERWALEGDARVLGFASFGFDSSVPDVWGSLARGATLVVRPARIKGGRELSDLVERARVTHVSLPPAVWRTVAPGPAWAHVRVCVTCGDAADPELAARWAPRRLLNEYGPTEITVCATSCELLPGEPVTIGSPIANVETWLLDTDLRPVPVGSPGELVLAGPGLAWGYAGRPDLTRERFVEVEPRAGHRVRAYRTGDVAAWTDGGTLRFLGRVDDQAKIRGFRVELGEVEAALRAIPGIRDAASRVVEGAAGKVLVGYLVEAEGSVSDAAVRTSLVTRLPAFMIPSAFVRLPSIPLTVHRKVDRSALPPPPAADADDALAGPTGDDAGGRLPAILEAFRATLGRPALAADASFFESGGDSLMAVELAALLEERLGVEIPVADVFAAPSPALFAALQRRRGNDAAHERGDLVVLPPLTPAPAAARLVAVLGARVAPRAPAAPRPEEPLEATLERWAQELADAGTAVLVGWSEGGKAALALASLLASRGRGPLGVVLVDTHSAATAAAHGAPPRSAMSAARADLDVRFEQGAPEVRVAYVRASGSPASTVASLERRVALVYAETVEGTHDSVIAAADLPAAIDRAVAALWRTDAAGSVLT